MLEFVKSSHKKSDSKKKKKNTIQQKKTSSNRGRPSYGEDCSEIESSSTSIPNAGNSDGPGLQKTSFGFWESH